MSRHVSGDLTLNQMRVLQFINLCSRYRSEATGHRKICSGLGLPSATVTRAVGKFVEIGVLAEEVDPDDARRRILAGTGVIPHTNQRLDIELLELTARMPRLAMSAPAAESVEQASVAQSQATIFELLTTLSKFVSGDLTLNQIRVMQFINLCWRHRSAGCTGHMDICSELNLPSATVSRAVAKFIKADMVGDEVDPDDGRKRLVVGSGAIPGAPDDDLDLVLARLFTR